MDMTVVESILTAVVVGCVALIVVISVAKDRFTVTIIAMAGLIAFFAQGRLLNESQITRTQLVAQINPSVPAKGYKWVGAKAWILYKDGKPGDIVIYER